MPTETAIPAAISPVELARLFDEFSRSTLKLQESHRALEARVCELSAQLDEKNRQLERKKRLEALGLTVAGVAHEIRNPLGGISLYLDCLSQEVRGDRSPEECSRLIKQIEEGVAHLNSVVESMLVFASSSEGNRRPIRALDLVDESLQLLKLELETTSISVEILPHGDDLVEGDPDQLRCVLVNVLKNAVQAMSPGPGAITIEVGSEAEACALRITDTGCGIPEENLEKVFVPFFSERQKKGGVGLGMTIVHSLTERNGGRVDLANIPGGGLEVTVILRRPEP